MECVLPRLIIIMCGAAKQQPAGEMNGSWELDFYRKYNENSPQVRYYQQTLLQPATHQPQQPLGEMVLVIEQIISLQRLGLSTHMYLDKLFNFTKYGKGYVGNN